VPAFHVRSLPSSVPAAIILPSWLKPTQSTDPVYFQGVRDRLSAYSVPYPDLTFRAPSDDMFAVGTEGSGDDCIVMLKRRVR
jgi:hypothetical protein